MHFHDSIYKPDSFLDTGHAWNIRIMLLFPIIIRPLQVYSILVSGPLQLPYFLEKLKFVHHSWDPLSVDVACTLCTIYQQIM